MMWVLLTFLFLTSTNKSFFFFNSFFFFECLNYSLLLLSPFMLMLCYETLFKSIEQKLTWKFMVLIFFLIFMMSLAFLSSSMMHFLIFLEMSIIPIVYLILIFSKLKDKILAAWSMFFFNIMGSAPFMILISLHSEFNVSILSSFFLEIYHEDSSLMMMLLFLPLLCFKIPIFLAHFWLTKAHVSAAGFCSMILASLSLKLGSFGLLKFSHLFKASSLAFTTALLAWSCLGFLYFTISMIRYTDVKYFVAMSSLTHMSFIMPTCLTSASMGCFSSLLMIVAHGLISPFFFLLITLLYETSNNRALDVNKSIESASKFLSVILVLCLLLNLGVPPFMGFFSELEILKFLYSFSGYSMCLYLSGALASASYFMFFCTKCIYGKKSFILTEDFSYMTYLHFIWMLLLLLLSLYLY